VLVRQTSDVLATVNCRYLCVCGPNWNRNTTQPLWATLKVGLTRQENAWVKTHRLNRVKSFTLVKFLTLHTLAQSVASESFNESSRYRNGSKT